MSKGWPAIALLAIVSAASGDELKPGSWILEIYRPDAPIDVIHISVIRKGDTFIFENADGDMLFEKVRVVDDEIEFRHPIFEEMCRLSEQADNNGWQGTCPPDNEPQFETGLTIWLRPPEAGRNGPDVDTEVSESGDSSQGASSQ